MVVRVPEATRSLSASASEWRTTRWLSGAVVPSLAVRCWCLATAASRNFGGMVLQSLPLPSLGHCAGLDFQTTTCTHREVVSHLAHVREFNRVQCFTIASRSPRRSYSISNCTAPIILRLNRSSQVFSSWLLRTKSLTASPLARSVLISSAPNPGNLTSRLRMAAF